MRRVTKQMFVFKRLLVEYDLRLFWGTSSGHAICNSSISAPSTFRASRGECIGGQSVGLAMACNSARTKSHVIPAANWRSPHCATPPQGPARPRSAPAIKASCALRGALVKGGASSPVGASWGTLAKSLINHAGRRLHSTNTSGSTPRRTDFETPWMAENTLGGLPRSTFLLVTQNRAPLQDALVRAFTGQPATCARSVRACNSRRTDSSSCVAAGVCARSAAKRNFQPHASPTPSRDTPG